MGRRPVTVMQRASGTESFVFETGGDFFIGLHDMRLRWGNLYYLLLLDIIHAGETHTTHPASECPIRRQFTGITSGYLDIWISRALLGGEVQG